jgi:esterase/lipase
MRRALAITLALAALLALYLLSPLPRHDLAPHAHPATTYTQALRLTAALAAQDSTPTIAPACRTILLTHGARTHRVIVLLHGLTNCPAQFDSLGRLCFARGANVLIPRLPRHGYADHMTDQLAHLDAEELRAFTDQVLDAAAGLGDSVTVAGLSMGGTMAAWAAAERPDVNRVVMIAPMLGLAAARGPLTPVVASLAGALPRFSTRSLAAVLHIGWFVRDEALHRAPVCHAIAVVTVGGDHAVDNALTAQVLNAWRRHGARDIETYEFPKSLHLNHDVVDPEQVDANVAVTYPVLMRAIGP